MASGGAGPVPSSEVTRSIGMLREVLDGQTYETVGERSGITRTAVERRIKTLATRLCRRVGIEGLNADGAAFVQRLRERRTAILAALDEFDPEAHDEPRAVRVVSSEELARAVQRIRGRSSRPLHDQALFLLLFATGLRPLEVARLQVRDYLNPDGGVRVESELRAEAANSGKARPLYFTSARLNQAMDQYLSERVLREREGCAAFDVEGRSSAGDGPGPYRGLDPNGSLFGPPTGEAFRIKVYGDAAQPRYVCRAILEVYRKLFRYAELTDVTPLSVRLTLAMRLYARGAEEEQVGQLLGISRLGAVRELFPKPRPSVPELVRELI